MKKGRSGSEASGSQKLRDVLTNPISVNTTNSMDKKLDHVENVPLSSIESMQEMKTYIKTLNEYKHKMEAMVDGIIKSVDAPRERSQDNDNIIIRKIPSATKGNPSSIMKCGIPLIVEPPLIHDVSHVVNDTFRDYLCHQLPGNKRKLFDSLELKEHLSLIEEIRRAEKDVMEVQERFLIADNKGDQIIELSKWTVEKYSLLCPARMFVNNANEEKENALNEQVVGEKYGIHGELRRLRMHLNKERPKLNVKYCVPGLLSNRELWTVEKPKEPVCLSVNTDFVHFNRFVSGRIYKKNAIITNTGKRLTPFYITVHGNGGSFEYDYTPRRPLAAGMSAKLTVTFKCTSMEDIYELLTITTRDDQKIGIIVFAENEKMPILKYITERYDCEKDFPKPNHRQSNCVFDCNACLLGAAKTISVTVTNIGRSSKFVCVPEDVWYTKSVKDVEWKQTMSLDGFKITPSMFEIKCGRSLALSVMFEPRSSMFYCSRFIIMSDNACAHQVNVFGDGETYDAGGVTFEGRGLQQWSADEAASYVLEMGRIGEVVRYVYAKNSSRIKYPYRWIINHDGIVDPGPTDRATVNFNIHPSSGTLDKLSRTAFRVECGVAANDDGTTTVDDRLAGKTYRVTAT